MMKLSRFLFLLGALLGLSGCPEPPCPPDISGGAGPTPPAVILVGESASLRISPIVSNGCGVENPESPRSLSVEVYGPDNLTVPSQSALGKPARASATVTFTPDKPGRYHVFAAFEPIGGIHQLDFYAARNRSAEAPLHTMTQLCGALERTRRGGWVCDSDFVRDGVAQRFPSARLAVAGDVVWVVDGSQTRRFVDTGTALELSATLTGGSVPIDALLASETELLAIRAAGIDRIVFDGTPALAVKGSALLPPSTGTVGSTRLRGLVVRSGDQLLVIVNSSASSTPQPINSYTSQACPYRIEPERILRTTDPCQTFSGDVVGYEPGGLWVGTRFPFGEFLSDLRWLEMEGGELVEQASLPLGMNFEAVKLSFSARNTAVPVLISSPTSPVSTRFQPTMPVYSPDQHTLLLEFLDSEMPQPSASTSLQWGAANASGTMLRIRVRPTTP